MKLVLILLITAVACQAATGIAPADAFATLPPGFTMNTDNWLGWMAGEIVPIVLPDSTYPEWWDYYAAVKKSWLPKTRMVFWPIPYNVGLDDAEEVAANYFWTHWPTSCGVTVCGSAANARAHKSLAPKRVTHLDLIGKGAKAVTKTTYRGVRVIL